MIVKFCPSYVEALFDDKLYVGGKTWYAVISPGHVINIPPAIPEIDP